MPDTNPSANMNLPVPIVGVDPGPQYATDLNSCLTIIDSHNHSAGSGVQITPNGLSINIDLPFGTNNATELRSVRFTSQLTPIATPSDLGCLYESGVDLYYNDGNGNQIQITSGGAVAGTPGSISGLISPASASYSSGPGTFIFESAAATPGNLDAASVTIREQVASPNGITIASPAALGSNYTITLPSALPASQKFVTLDNSGNMSAPWAVDNSTIEVSSNTVQVKSAGITQTQLANNSVGTAQIIDQNVTQAKLAPRSTGTTVGAGGVAISNSCGVFSTNSGTPVLITNFTITITTTGRPVMLKLIDDGSGTNPSQVGGSSVLSTTLNPWIRIYRDATQIAWLGLTNDAGGTFKIYSSLVSFLDEVAAGTYVYTMTLELQTGTSADIQYTKFVAYEI